jgi:hypothetical protein
MIRQENEDGPKFPVLPYGWSWEAAISGLVVTVRLKNKDVVLASRTGEPYSPDKWEWVIYRLAADLWKDVNEAAKLSAKLGIEVIYE